MDNGRRPWLTVAGVLLGLGVVGALLLRPAAGPPLAEAPRFVAHAIDSAASERTLDHYRGQPLLLNVWATWCDPCREEMPSMERLYQRYAARGLRIAAVSIDDADQLPLVREFVAEHRLTFDILHSRGSAIMSQYPVRGVPQTFLISRGGRLLGSRFAADWMSPPYLALVDSLLAAP
jgi:thiol-disulfide isomerase/thioredoxin